MRDGDSFYGRSVNADVPSYSASQAIFSAGLHNRIDRLEIGLSQEMKTLVLSSLKAVFLLPESDRVPILQAYMAAVTPIFLIGVAASVFASLSALLIKRGGVAMPK